jgi:hypothetical protein
MTSNEQVVRYHQKNFRHLFVQHSAHHENSYSVSTKFVGILKEMMSHLNEYRSWEQDICKAVSMSNGFFKGTNLMERIQWKDIFIVRPEYYWKMRPLLIEIDSIIQSLELTDIDYLLMEMEEIQTILKSPNKFEDVKEWSIFSSACKLLQDLKTVLCMQFKTCLRKLFELFRDQILNLSKFNSKAFFENNEKEDQMNVFLDERKEKLLDISNQIHGVREHICILYRRFITTINDWDVKDELSYQLKCKCDQLIGREHRLIQLEKARNRILASFLDTNQDQYTTEGKIIERMSEQSYIFESWYGDLFRCEGEDTRVRADRVIIDGLLCNDEQAIDKVNQVLSNNGCPPLDISQLTQNKGCVIAYLCVDFRDRIGELCHIMDKVINEMNDLVIDGDVKLYCLPVYLMA